MNLVENPESHPTDLKACQQAYAETLTPRTTPSFLPALSSQQLVSAATAAAALRVASGHHHHHSGRRKGAQGCCTLFSSGRRHLLILQTPAPLATPAPAQASPSLPLCFILYPFSSHSAWRHFSAAHGNWVPPFVCHIPCKFPPCPFRLQ